MPRFVHHSNSGHLRESNDDLKPAAHEQKEIPKTSPPVEKCIRELFGFKRFGLEYHQLIQLPANQIYERTMMNMSNLLVVISLQSVMLFDALFQFRSIPFENSEMLWCVTVCLMSFSLLWGLLTLQAIFVCIHCLGNTRDEFIRDAVAGAANYYHTYEWCQVFVNWVLISVAVITLYFFVMADGGTGEKLRAAGVPVEFCFFVTVACMFAAYMKFTIHGIGRSNHAVSPLSNISWAEGMFGWPHLISRKVARKMAQTVANTIRSEWHKDRSTYRSEVLNAYASGQDGPVASSAKVSPQPDVQVDEGCEKISEAEELVRFMKEKNVSMDDLSAFLRNRLN